MINTREIAKEYRLAHWAQIIRERNESGLSVKTYCLQNGICSNTYFYWQRRLRTEAAQNYAEMIAKSETSSVALVPKGWAICEEPSALHAGTVEISIGKCRITATAHTNLGLLKSVIQTLTDIC